MPRSVRTHGKQGKSKTIQEHLEELESFGRRRSTEADVKGEHLQQHNELTWLDKREGIAPWKVKLQAT